MVFKNYYEEFCKQVTSTTCAHPNEQDHKTRPLGAMEKCDSRNESLQKDKTFVAAKS